jgi:hypothetical protein
MSRRSRDATRLGEEVVFEDGRQGVVIGVIKNGSDADAVVQPSKGNPEFVQINDPRNSR